MRCRLSCNLHDNLHICMLSNFYICRFGQRVCPSSVKRHANMQIYIYKFDLLGHSIGIWINYGQLFKKKYRAEIPRQNLLIFYSKSRGVLLGISAGYFFADMSWRQNKIPSKRSLDRMCLDSAEVKTFSFGTSMVSFRSHLWLEWCQRDH